MNRLDKLKAEIAEMGAGEFAEWIKINLFNRCRYCAEDKYNCNENCSDNIQAYLEQEIKPPKTLAYLFFERNPGAEKDVSGQPQCCAKQVGLINDCPCANCVDCWNRPYEEEKGNIE